MNKTLKNIHNDPKVTYFLCPDSKCNLFTKKNCVVPCENCPENAQKVIICKICGEPIYLSSNSQHWIRITCCCGGENFRMRGIYQRVNI